MKRVAILVPNSPCILSSVVGAYKVFTLVNSTLASQGKGPYFEIKMVGLSNETHLYEGLFVVYPEVLAKDLKKTDLVIIPAFNGDIPACLKLNQDYIPWIVDQYKHGAEVASL